MRITFTCVNSSENEVKRNEKQQHKKQNEMGMRNAW